MNFKNGLREEFEQWLRSKGFDQGTGDTYHMFSLKEGKHLNCIVSVKPGIYHKGKDIEVDTLNGKRPNGDYYNPKECFRFEDGRGYIMNYLRTYRVKNILDKL